MASGSDQFSMEEDGAVLLNSGETNAVYWKPTLSAALNNARDATYFTRLETHHSYPMLKAVLDLSSEVDETFCVSVNNVILVFTVGTHEEHRQHVRKVLEMMQTHSLRADATGCAFDARTSADAGIRFKHVGQRLGYIVINDGPPRR